MCKISLLDKISFVLLLIGAITWGVIGLFSINIISLLVGGSILLQRIIYIAILGAAIDLVLVLIKCKSLVTFK
ncbi:DUF378 domain-containing protein [Clostridium carnis]